MTEQSIHIYSPDEALMPVTNVQAAIQRFQDQKDFITKVLRENVDFGIIPGTTKNTLLKPGAEKLSFFFGLHPTFEDVEHVEDWTGKDHDGEPFFYYRVKCSLLHNGRLAASADGSCNSQEKKYRYRWVVAGDIPAGMDKAKLPTKGGRISEFEFALEKAETSGQYGKPAAYWAQFNSAIQNGTATAITRKTKAGKELPAFEIDSTLYAIPNTEMADLVNTILKMAQKRALIAAILIGANASEWFTQDVEDFTDGTFYEAPQTPSNPQPTPTGKTQTNASVSNDLAPDNDASQPVLDNDMPDNVKAAMKIRFGSNILGEMDLESLATIVEDESKAAGLRKSARLIIDWQTK